MRFIDRIIEFLGPEVKITIVDKELHIDGFKELWVESKGNGEFVIPKYKIHQLRRVIGLLSDQPLTIKIGHTSDWIEVYNLTI